jgi:hypothetical protein
MTDDRPSSAIAELVKGLREECGRRLEPTRGRPIGCCRSPRPPKPSGWAGRVRIARSGRADRARSPADVDGSCRRVRQATRRQPLPGVRQQRLDPGARLEVRPSHPRPLSAVRRPHHPGRAICRTPRRSDEPPDPLCGLQQLPARLDRRAMARGTGGPRPLTPNPDSSVNRRDYNGRTIFDKPDRPLRVW